jgi:putative endonuclease
VVTEARLALGKRGEIAAREYLQRFGVRILEANFTCAAGEIDLIGQEGNGLVFVEVKTRSSDTFGPPQLAVHRRKQRQIARAAQWYLTERRMASVPCRFDVLGIVFPRREEAPRITWLRDAFPAEGVDLW